MNSSQILMEKYSSAVPQEALDLLVHLEANRSVPVALSPGEHTKCSESELAEFRRILTSRDPEVSKLWQFVVSQGPIEEGLSYAAIFAQYVHWGIVGKIENLDITQNEVDIWKKQVADTAMKLARLIHGTGLDDYLGDIDVARVKESVAELSSLEGDPLSVGLQMNQPVARYERHDISFSDLLNSFAVSGVGSVPPVPLKRPGGSEVRRTFFIQMLANYFEKTSGNPQITHILSAASAVFSDFGDASESPLSRKQVSDIVKSRVQFTFFKYPARKSKSGKKMKQ